MMFHRRQLQITKMTMAKKGGDNGDDNGNNNGNDNSNGSDNDNDNDNEEVRLEHLQRDELLAWIGKHLIEPQGKQAMKKGKSSFSFTLSH